jgi:hypothetical protein
MQDGRNDNRALNANGNYDETRDCIGFTSECSPDGSASYEEGYEVNYAGWDDESAWPVDGRRHILPEMMRVVMARPGGVPPRSPPTMVESRCANPWWRGNGTDGGTGKHRYLIQKEAIKQAFAAMGTVKPATRTTPGRN